MAFAFKRGESMIKIIKNNLIIDVCAKKTLLRYIPELKRFITTGEYNANAILGSDINTTYHIMNTDYNFDTKIESVIYEEIGEDEYNRLTSEISRQVNTENEDLKNEVSSLKKMVAQQNELISQLIDKLK